MKKWSKKKLKKLLANLQRLKQVVWGFYEVAALTAVVVTVLALEIKHLWLLLR